VYNEKLSGGKDHKKFVKINVEEFEFNINMNGSLYLIVLFVI